jgi:hypothetical protein
MSVSTLLQNGRLQGKQLYKLDRAEVRAGLAERQERALLDNDEWNEAFKTFVHDRDNDLADDAISLGAVL